MQRSPTSHRQRELRRRVLLPARVRGTAGWSDACILNVSSRGLLIHLRDGAEAGTTIELHHQQHAIVARVMWRDGARAGLRCTERVPVEQIMVLGQAQDDTFGRGDARADVERRKRPRHDHSRNCGRAIEFIGATAIAVLLAMGALTVMRSAFARPLAAITATLAG